MSNSSKRNGDRAEIEVQGLLRDLLGVPARRQLGAGRKDDVGDIAGVPQTVIQVVDMADKTRAIREKPIECERQQRERENMTSAYSPTFGATFVRLRGGEYRVLLTPEQWAFYWREGVGALSDGKSKR